MQLVLFLATFVCQDLRAWDVFKLPCLEAASVLAGLRFGLVPQRPLGPKRSFLSLRKQQVQCMSCIYVFPAHPKL